MSDEEAMADKPKAEWIGQPFFIDRHLVFDYEKTADEPILSSMHTTVKLSSINS